jgi:hypothetical protein
VNSSSFFPLTGTSIKNIQTIGILAITIVALYAELPYLVTLSAHDINRGMTMIIKEIQRICMGCCAISLKAAKEFSMTPYGQISSLEQGINWRIGRAISQMIKPTMP